MGERDVVFFSERPAVERSAREDAIGLRRHVDQMELAAVAHELEFRSVGRPVRIVVVMTVRREHAFGTVGKRVGRDRLRVAAVENVGEAPAVARPDGFVAGGGVARDDRLSVAAIRCIRGEDGAARHERELLPVGREVEGAERARERLVRELQRRRKAARFYRKFAHGRRRGVERPEREVAFERDRVPVA